MLVQKWKCFNSFNILAAGLLLVPGLAEAQAESDVLMMMASERTLKGALGLTTMTTSDVRERYL